MKKPGPIPNVVGGALIQVIDETTMRWKTVARVIDAPNPIAKEVDKLKAMGYKNLWAVNVFGERRPLF